MFLAGPRPLPANALRTLPPTLDQPHLASNACELTIFPKLDLGVEIIDRRDPSGPHKWRAGGKADWVLAYGNWEDSYFGSVPRGGGGEKGLWRRDCSTALGVKNREREEEETNRRRLAWPHGTARRREGRGRTRPRGRSRARRPRACLGSGSSGRTPLGARPWPRGQRSPRARGRRVRRKDSRSGPCGGCRPRGGRPTANAAGSRRRPCPRQTRKDLLCARRRPGLLVAGRRQRGP